MHKLLTAFLVLTFFSPLIAADQGISSEVETRKAQLEERLKHLTPEQRAAWDRRQEKRRERLNTLSPRPEQTRPALK